MPHFALSDQQSAIASLSQTGVARLGQVVITIDGPIDAAILGRAWQTVIARHDIFHTAFSMTPGQTELVQTPVASGPAAWTMVVACGGESEERRTVDELMAREGAATFDLEQPPLARAVLIAGDAERHWLIVTVHPLCVDACTLVNVATEVAQAYETCLSGAEWDEPVQYLQYCEYHREVVGDGDRDTFMDVPVPVLPMELAGDHRGTPGVCAFTLDAPVVGALGDVAAEWRIAPCDVLFACWHLLIARLSGGGAEQLGLLVDGRGHEELAEVMGPFAKVLPVAGRVDGAGSFRALAVASASARTHLEERAERDTWRPGQPPVTFGVLPSVEPIRRLNVTFSVLRFAGCFDPFKLKLLCQADGARLELHHDASFLATDVRCIASRFVVTLKHALREPHVRVDRLDVLTDEDRRQLIVDWNRTDVLEPWRGTVAARVAVLARETPDAVAVVCEDDTLTYAALQVQVRQLARVLRRQGAGAEVRVGVCLERSVELVVALLAVWDAGGAYVPVAPTDPVDRIAWILADAGARIVVTAPRWTSRIAADSVIAWEPALSFADDQVEEAGADGAGGRGDEPGQLAYVLYTSGSTGRPKGVLVQHGSLSQYLNWAVRAYDVAGGWGAPVASPVAFDLTVTSLFAPLMAGRTIVLVREGDELEGLARVLRTWPDASLLKITPAHLDGVDRLLENVRGVGIHVRRLVIGGEALHGETLRPWREAAPATRVVNEYGPTETVVGCCVYDRAASEIGSGAVPIGGPVGGARLYVLDDHAALVPPGVVGELYTGGAGVTRGYNGQPALTAERFVPDTLGDGVGGRLYRTGDRCRWRVDGTLEYVGRTDHQVKIRGHRIELGEIAAVLREHEDVRDAVVLAREDASGQRQLVAYALRGSRGASISSVDAAGLLAFLRERLPAFMMPTVVVLLDEWPQTINGKVDRSALPAPVAREESATLEDATLTEQAIADIWADVLQRPQVGLQQNFFDLGGYSLLAVQIMSRVRRVFDVEVPLAAFFDGPTVRELAVQVKRHLEDGCHAQLPPIMPAPRDGTLPLSFAQQALWIENQMAGGATYNITAAVRLAGPLNRGLLRRTLNEIVRRHEVLRTTFVTGPSGPRQVISEDTDVALEDIDLADLPDDERSPEMIRAMADRCHTVFDLATGPLLRATLFRPGADEHVAHLTLHHILSDQWSTGILINEISTLYAALADQRPSPLPELPVQYADYAIWQRTTTRDALAGKISYWTRTLEGAPIYLNLPTDRPRPPQRSYYGDSERLVLSRELTQGLKALARQQRGTLYATLLAVLQVLLYRYSGQEDFVIGTPFANRSTPELAKLIGFFVNLVPVRARLSRTLTFSELLAQVRAACIGAYAHQEVPFDQLLHAMRLVRGADRVPLVQVVFALQNAPVQALRLPGLQARRVDLPVRSAAFDLTFGLTEREGQLTGEVNYNTDLFERATARRLAAHFVKLAEACVADPDISILAVPLTDEAPAPALPESIAGAVEFVF